MSTTPTAAAFGAAPSTSQFVRGAMYGIATVSIWAGWIVTTRLGVTTNLSVFDLAALRFGVGGLILLPIVLHRGFALDRLGWGGLLSIAIGGGAPFVFAAGGGLSFAPVAHAGALFPGVMPLFVARTSHRPVSIARTRAISRCWCGPMESPNHASLLTVTSSAASGRSWRTALPNAIS